MSEHEMLNLLKIFHLRRLYFFLKDRQIIGKKRQTSKLFNNATGRFLIRYFGGDEGHLINRETGNIGFGLIHYALVRNLNPTRVLCIGSRRGFIPAICALACQDNNKGNVDFVDAGYDRNQPAKHWSGVGFWKKVIPQKHFSTLNLGKWITTYVMTSGQFADKFPKRRYGYIYVDGDHSYEGVKKDFEAFWPRLEKNGFMSFHDIVAKGYLDGGEFGVWKFWNELENVNKIEFPFPDKPPEYSGLGIIQKI